MPEVERSWGQWASELASRAGRQVELRTFATLSMNAYPSISAIPRGKSHVFSRLRSPRRHVSQCRVLKVWMRCAVAVRILRPVGFPCLRPDK